MRFLNRVVFGVALIAMLSFAALLKWPALDNGAPNLEASYHVLLTDTALRESPASSHHFLPTVSLGAPQDKGVAWGATLRVASGDYVYTSFAPPAFVAPFVFFKLTGLPIALASLMQFNFLLLGLATIALAVLLLKLLALAGVREPVALIATAAAVSVQIFASETLLSFGVVYWAQQVYQVLFLSSLIVMAAILERDGRRCRALTVALVCLCFFGVWTDWTGLVFNAGVALVLLRKARTEPQYRPIALAVIGASAAGLIVLVAHYAVFAGALPTAKAFVKRFLARSAGHGNPFDLLTGYGQSFGLLIPLAILSVVVLLRDWRGQAMPHPRGVVIAVLACSLFPLLENVLMMQHASEFSFDRLKAAVPIAILVAFAFAASGWRGRLVGLLLLVGALAQNVAAYHQRLAPYAGWQQTDRANHRFAQRIAASVDLPCAVLASTQSVRGYANLLFHRAINENIPPPAFDKLAATMPARRCGAVYLEETKPFTDMPRYTGALIRRAGYQWRLDNKE